MNEIAALTGGGVSWVPLRRFERFCRACCVHPMDRARILPHNSRDAEYFPEECSSNKRDELCICFLFRSSRCQNGVAPCSVRWNTMKDQFIICYRASSTR